MSAKTGVDFAPLTDFPIPPVAEEPNWGRLPIEECNEPLVTLATIPGRLYLRPLYYDQKIPGSVAAISARQGIARRLQSAAEMLPPGIALVAFDVYRPLAVQQFLYDSYRESLRLQYPDYDDEKLIATLHQYVASPNADPACPPPHRTGGATDVYLISADGESLPMGTAPDEATPASATRWFEERHTTPFTENRRLLYRVMTAAGFANYPGEWWHYDFGNQRWANITGAPHAIYGIPDETEYYL
jgi:D-alanyl-D-alanine dipeptidase